MLQTDGTQFITTGFLNILFITRESQLKTLKINTQLYYNIYSFHLTHPCKTQTWLSHGRQFCKHTNMAHWCYVLVLKTCMYCEVTQLNHRTQDHSSRKVRRFNILIHPTRYTIKQVRKCLQSYNFGACVLLLSVYFQFVNIIKKTYSHMHSKFQQNFPHLTQHIICHLCVLGIDLHLIMLNLYCGDRLSLWDRNWSQSFKQ